MENTADLEITDIPSVLTQIKAPALVTLIVSKELDNLSTTRKLAGEAFLNSANKIEIVHPEGKETVDDLVVSFIGDDEKVTDKKVLLIDGSYSEDTPGQSLPELTSAVLGLVAQTHNLLVVYLTERTSAAIEQDSYMIAEVIPEEDGKCLLTVSKHRKAVPGIYPFAL